MEIRQLRHFVAVADTLNFREAAERCGITQQAISKSIMQLEAWLAFRAFERDRKSVRITDHGALLLPYARTILAEKRRFEEVLADISGRGFGQLKIGAAPALLDQIVPSALQRFRALHPGIRIGVETGDFVRLREMMLQGDLDLVLATAPDEAQGHLVALEQVGTDRNVVVARAGHPLAGLPEVTCDDLARYPLVAMQNYRKGDAYIARLFSLAGRPVPNPPIRTASTEFALAWVQRSDDWWVVPQRQVMGALAAGAIVQVPVTPQDESWLLVLATRRHATLSPAARSFAEQVRALAGEEALVVNE